ncbi:hypothetical protein DC897_RS22390 [Vibrio parahaemolyticus]|uniref:hypothetical protein n=1 Tax=Vibrio parahaemolyticus TaxID=670 RepID=UPI00114776D9|nr:hypothetical protein [Vibrio parahaemolyticus]EGQ8312363.1 hypothetical protein [Vibrio parahaemolyticus]EGQ8852974.1 hypothetical protein [Vibrio parahaemolyticus]EGQ8857624.1 hypothetical protein [Vibrio parahaemolyticus]EGQ8877081.1 hypothetical protein [Vibrio parahaemolyticus]EGQ8996279.1 hypothetical protein [Vibrio parahaemolyticus]
MLTLVCSLGVGVALGGGNTPNTGNSLNGIIAFFTALSALTTLGTLILLILFRHDWKTPKEHDSKLETIVSVKKWERSVRALHSKISNNATSSVRSYIALGKKDLEYELNNEKEYWSELEYTFDIYMHYTGKSSGLSSQFDSLDSVRTKIRSDIDLVLQQPSPFYQVQVTHLTIHNLERLISQVEKDIGTFLTRLNQGN